MTSNQPKEDNQETLPKMEYRQVLFSPTGTLVGIIVLAYVTVSTDTEWYNHLRQDALQHAMNLFTCVGLGNLLGAIIASSIPVQLTSDTGEPLEKPMRLWKMPFHPAGIGPGLIWAIHTLYKNTQEDTTAVHWGSDLLFILSGTLIFCIFAGVIFRPDLPEK